MWRSSHETNLRFFSSRRARSKSAARAALFPSCNSSPIGVWRSWLARAVWDREVEGSSPFTPTKKISVLLDRYFLLYTIAFFASPGCALVSAAGCRQRVKSDLEARWPAERRHHAFRRGDHDPLDQEILEIVDELGLHRERHDRDGASLDRRQDRLTVHLRPVVELPLEQLDQLLELAIAN